MEVAAIGRFVDEAKTPSTMSCWHRRDADPKRRLNMRLLLLNGTLAMRGTSPDNEWVRTPCNVPHKMSDALTESSDGMLGYTWLQ